VNPDYRDLLSEFNAHGVEYFVVGAYALAAHGRVRATGDLDIWVEHLIRNKRSVGRAQDLADLEWLEHPEKRES
jgi:hypothetical protein